MLRQLLRAGSALSELGEKRRLGLILLVGLLNGLLFVFVVPPWQHYDEPGHFEYAWLMANRPGLPQPGDYDQGMRREVAASMVEHDFFAGLGFFPNLLSQGDAVWIGIAQVGDPPVYYWLASLPLRLVRTSDITFQLYLARLVSWLLYLLSLGAAYGLATELTVPGSRLRWAIPLAMSLLPGYVDVMTAVNNDVGAIAFGSGCVWLGVRLIQRPFDWRNAAGAFLLALLCLFTKNTVAVTLPLAGVAFLLSLCRGRFRRLVWAGIGLASFVLLIVSLAWNGAAAWYGESALGRVERQLNDTAPTGRYILQLTSPANGPERTRALQLFPDLGERALQGATVTVGAWMWASQEIDVRTPVLDDGVDKHYETVSVTSTPVFYAYTAQIADSATMLRIILESGTGRSAPGVAVYYDGVVFVEGDFAQSGIPEFDEAGEYRLWGTKTVENLVRNWSFEYVWPQVSPRLNQMIAQVFPFQPSQVLLTFSDWSSSSWYYQAAIENLLRSFWAKFGWGHVALAGTKPYRILSVMTAVGIVGSVVVAWRKRATLPWDALLFMALMGGVIWLAAVFRGINSIAGQIFIPGARYAYPAILPTVVVLATGWLESLDGLRRVLHWPGFPIGLVYGALFVSLDVMAIFSVLNYYGVP